MGPESPLFLLASNNSKGDRLGYWGIYDFVTELAAIAGVKDAHPHQGRHTFASRLIEDRMDAYLVMQLTRHRSVQAFKTYSNNVRHQAAKSAYWKGQGDKGREAQSLEELLEGRR